MIRSVAFTCALMLSVTASALALPQPSGSPAPSPAASSAASPAAEDPAVTAAVKKQFLDWQAGKVDRADYNAQANAQLTDAVIAQVSPQLQALGPPVKFTFMDRMVKDDNRIYIYGVDTAKAKVQMLYALDSAGKISGIFFRPAQ
jgi:membrane-bound lytic murein transglycosylase B